MSNTTNPVLPNQQHGVHNEEALLAAIQELIDLYLSNDTIRPAASHEKNLPALHGLVAHSFATGIAARDLVVGGDAYIAQVLARTSFEHALTAVWVQQCPKDGVSQFMTKTDWEGARLYRYVEEKGLLDLPDDVHAYFSNAPRSKEVAEELRFFRTLCDHFDSSGWLYGQYKALSNAVHPTAEVRSYVHTEVNPYSLLRRATVPPEPVLSTVALALTLAAWVYEDIRKFKPNRPKVERLAKQFGFDRYLTVKQ